MPNIPSESYNTAILTGSKLTVSNDTITKVQRSCRPQLNFTYLPTCLYLRSHRRHTKMPIMGNTQVYIYKGLRIRNNDTHCYSTLYILHIQIVYISRIHLFPTPDSTIH